MASDGGIGLTYWLVCLTFISCLLVVQYTDATCKFPEFLQTNSSSRDWKGRIKQQNTEVTLRISISENMIRVVSTDSTATSYTRVCVRMYGDKYLVAHEEQGQDGARFTCLQFVQRSDNVLQFREAPVGRSMQRSVCSSDNLQLNPWLIIDTNHVADDVRLAPLEGGFSVHIFDKKYRRDICDSYQGKTRIESECAAGEGLIFLFRYRRCVPGRLFMYPTQRTLCLAHWQEGPYTFALLRHDHRSQYMWVLRYPTGLGDSFTMILFNDLVADMDPHGTETRNFFRLDAIRDTPRPANKLCVDEYEVCSYTENPCDDAELAMTCPRTCNICHSTRPRICTFENKYQGQWYNAAEPGSLALTVNTSLLTTYSNNLQEQLYCIEWDSEPTPSSTTDAKTQMLVREFTNGCRPRYSCVAFMQSSSSALFFKLSQGRSWPFTSTPDESIDCSNFIYEEEESLHPNPFRNRNFNLVYVRASNSVSCSLPRTAGEYIATFRGGEQCTSSIIQNQTANGFTLELTNCSGSDLGGSYTCADSTRMFPRRDQLLITRSGSNPDLIYCWLLPRRQHDVFYIIKASDCNEALRKKLSRGRLKPLVTITRSGIIPHLDYEDKEPNELPTVITNPPVQRPYPTHNPSERPPTPFYKVVGPSSLPDEELVINSSVPTRNSTASDVDIEMTVKSVAVVSMVLIIAVFQTLCICKC